MEASDVGGDLVLIERRMEIELYPSFFSFMEGPWLLKTLLCDFEKRSKFVKIICRI